jgi:hypothetical protein
MKFFGLAALCSLLLSQSIHAQEKGAATFRDFIGLLKHGQAGSSLCLKFLRVSPYTTDYGDTLTMRVFLERPNYAAILMTSTKTSYYSEARPVETFDTVETYDWDGNKLDAFEYGYEIDGGFHEKSIRSEINEFDEIKQTTHYTEVVVEPVNLEIPGNPQYDFRTVLDTTYTRHFRISENGVRSDLGGVSFREFIELFKLQQADSRLCRRFLDRVPKPVADEDGTLALSVFLERPNYVAIQITFSMRPHFGKSTVETYDWDGNKRDSFEYGGEERGSYYLKSVRSEINDRDEITRTTRTIEDETVVDRDPGEPHIEYFRISDNGVFERIEY